jgi:hypothetical protein
MEHIAVDHAADASKQNEQVQILYLFSEALAKKKQSPGDEEVHTSAQQQALDVLENDVIPLAPSKHSECEARCLVGRIYKARCSRLYFFKEGVLCVRMCYQTSRLLLLHRKM